MKMRLLLVTAFILLVLYTVSHGTRYVPQGQYPSIPPRTCLAVTINVQTGEMVETPVPCLRPTGTGCTGSVTARPNGDGTVTSSCVPGSGNPSEQ